MPIVNDKFRSKEKFKGKNLARLLSLKGIERSAKCKRAPLTVTDHKPIVKIKMGQNATGDEAKRVKCEMEKKLEDIFKCGSNGLNLVNRFNDRCNNEYARYLLFWTVQSPLYKDPNRKLSKYEEEKIAYCSDRYNKFIAAIGTKHGFEMCEIVLETYNQFLRDTTMCERLQ